MAVDWDKPIQVAFKGDEDFTAARYLGRRKSPESYGQHIVVADYGSYEAVLFACEDGRVDDYRSIVNVAQKHAIWLNCYAGDDGEVAHCHWHDSREGADHWASLNCNRRIACIRIDFEEGEGLS